MKRGDYAKIGFALFNHLPKMFRGLFIPEADDLVFIVSKPEGIQRYVFDLRFRRLPFKVHPQPPF
jgi:hypothetical protein